MTKLCNLSLIVLHIQHAMNEQLPRKIKFSLI